ncbi:SH3 domain-containing protein [Thalassolituus marinus]|uniref:SH3 domain-containing protein n=1 Tax=Thalassolituus marinus TaxID=671053 RepID=A0ABS7ZWD1_9GAMM|nr:SH3 domain-containing protein [Thalassolituus marinus]MCA6065423.1 SH3 domain-containing protein [Thalassolituus marinus]
MDKSIQNILNPPWMEAIQRLQNQISPALLAGFDSPTLQAARKLSDEVEAAYRLVNSANTMRSAMALVANARIPTLPSIDLNALKSAQAMVATSTIAKSLLPQMEILKLVEEAKTLMSVVPLDEIQSGEWDDDLQEIQAEGLSFESLKSEVSSDAQSFQDWSRREKAILIFFLTIIVNILTNIGSSYIYDAIKAEKEIQKELSSKTSAAEIRGYARHPKTGIDRDILKNYRVTTASNLNLRDAPSSKANVIESLPIGTMVEVQDSSNRSWLLVTVDVNGITTDGWISRRYTTYFK